MFFQFLFTRFHSVDQGAKESYIKGKLKGAEVFSIPVRLNRQDNQWVASCDSQKRQYLAQDTLLDELVVGPNLDINNVNLYFNLTHFEKTMDRKRRQDLGNRQQSEPIILATPNGKVIDQELLKKVLNELKTKVAPQAFKPADAQPQSPKKPETKTPEPAKKSPEPDSAPPADTPTNKRKQDAPQQPPQDPAKKEDFKKLLRRFLKVGQQLMMLGGTLKSLEKVLPKIEKEVAQAQQSQKLGAPTWPFSRDLLLFSTLHRIEAANDAVARWRRQQISERVLVNEAVEVYLDAMYRKDLTEEQILAEYPAGIMLEVIRSHLPAAKFDALKQIVVKQIREHTSDSELLGSLQRDIMGKFQKEIQEFQKALQEELASKLASKLRQNNQNLEERVLGEAAEEASSIFDSMYTDADEFDLSSILGEAHGAFGGQEEEMP